MTKRSRRATAGLPRPQSAEGTWGPGDRAGIIAVVAVVGVVIWSLAVGRRSDPNCDAIAVDVLLVAFVASLPAVTWGGVWIGAEHHGSVRWSLVAGAAFAGGLLLLGTAPGSNAPAWWNGGESLQRGLLAACAAVLLVWSLWTSRPPSDNLEPAIAWSSWSVCPRIVLALVIWWLVPQVYLEARYQADRQRLAELLDQSRIGEACQLATRLAALQPQLLWRGQSIHQFASELRGVTAEIEQRLDRTPQESTDPADRIDRARDLAVLGATEAALVTLAPLAEKDTTPAVHQLRGVIWETRGEFARSEQAYRRALDLWQQAPAGNAAIAGRIRALTGLAYCARKQGRYDEAARWYEQLLALSPTAEHHFLLAQFYEDAQDTERAYEHARQASSLHPERFSATSHALIHRLMTRHFGCGGIWWRAR